MAGKADRFIFFALISVPAVLKVSSSHAGQTEIRVEKINLQTFDKYSVEYVCAELISEVIMKYLEIRSEMEVMFERGVSERGLTLYQAFGYAYDEMDNYLKSKVGGVRLAAYVSLFIVPVKAGLAFVAEDNFTQDVASEFLEVYFSLQIEERCQLFEDGAVMLADAREVFECFTRFGLA